MCVRSEAATSAQPMWPARGGKGLAIATLVLDAFKGWLPVFLVLTLPVFHASSPAQLHTLATFAALMAVIGHMFPVWLGFKGGKGVATGLGVFLALAPKVVLIALALFLVIVALTRYVSLGSILAAAAFPAALWWLERDSFPAAALAMCAAAALLIIVRHHQNIATPVGRHRKPLRRKKGIVFMARIAVIGAGAWGTALAIALARGGSHQLKLWAYEKEVVESIRATHVNEAFLSGCRSAGEH